MKRIYDLFYVLFFIAAACVAHAQVSDSALEIANPGYGIGAIQKVIYADQARMIAIDELDQRHFLTMLSRKDSGFEIDQRFYLGKKVTSFYHYLDKEDLIIAIGTDEGKLKLFNANKKSLRSEISISKQTIHSISLKSHQVGSIEQLLVSSDSKLYVVDITDNSVVTAYDVGEGAMVQGSFTTKGAHELLFSDGSIYTFGVSGVKKIASLTKNKLQGVPILAKDEDGDGLDEVYLQSGGVELSLDNRSLSLFSVKDDEYIWSRGYGSFRSLFPSENGGSPKALMVSDWEIIYPIEMDTNEYCVLTLGLEVTSVCYEKPFEYNGYTRNVTAFVYDFDADGKLDLFESTAEPYSLGHTAYSNIEDPIIWKRIFFPDFNFGCFNSYHNSIIRYQGEDALKCIRSSSHITAMGNFSGRTSYFTSSIETGNWLSRGDVSEQFFRDYTKFYDDVNGDNVDDVLIYMNFREGVTPVNQIVVVDGTDESTSIDYAPLIDAFGEEKPLKVIYSTKDKGIYFLFSSGIWFYSVGEGIKAVDYQVQFADIAPSAFLGKQSLFGLSEDGHLHLLKSDGVHEQQLSLCESGKAFSLNEVSATTLVFSCEGYFGLYDTANKLVEWQYDEPLHFQRVFFKALNDIGYFYTSGSDPIVYKRERTEVTSKELAPQSLSVHVASSVDFKLKNWFLGDYYSIEHHPYTGDLGSVDPQTGAFQYQPSVIGKEYLSYKVMSDDMAVAHGSVIIEAYNNEPQVQSLELPIHWQGVSTVNLIGEDIDFENINYEIVSQPDSGTIVNLNSETGKIEFDPQASLADFITFSYQVTDLVSHSDTAQVVLKLTNTIPQAQSAEYKVTKNQTFTVQLKAEDADADPMSYHLVDAGSLSGISLDSASGELKVSSNQMTRAMTFEFYVSDGRDQSEPQKVTLNIDNSELSNENGASGSFGMLFFWLQIMIIALSRRAYLPRRSK